jgi:hypothetical protein
VPWALSFDAKDARSRYEPGKRSGRWEKFKLNLEEEFVIGGFVPSGNGGVETLVLTSTHQPFADIPTRKPGGWWHTDSSMTTEDWPSLCG